MDIVRQGVACTDFTSRLYYYYYTIILLFVVHVYLSTCGARLDRTSNNVAATVCDDPAVAWQLLVENTKIRFWTSREPFMMSGSSRW